MSLASNSARRLIPGVPIHVVALALALTLTTSTQASHHPFVRNGLGCRYGCCLTPACAVDSCMITTEHFRTLAQETSPSMLPVCFPLGV